MVATPGRDGGSPPAREGPGTAGPGWASAVVLLALLLLGTGCATFVQGLLPQGPPAGSESARRLRQGPWEVDRRDLRLVDASRPTPANGGFPGAATRTLEATVWLPKRAPGFRPLVIYSHGFLSERRDGAYLARHLASHGYVVASADYPLSNGHAPGGPTLRDVGNQPGDVSFLIDTLLDAKAATAATPAAAVASGRTTPAAAVASGRTTPAAALPVGIDRDRIGAVGLSLGGLTTTLVAFHPDLRDPRVRAAVSIAGPLFLFSPAFFETAHVPFLVIAGTDDAFIDYETNAGVVAERDPGALLLTLKGASHAGFADVASRLLWFWPNPDRLGCWYLHRRVDLEREAEGSVASFGGAKDGVTLPAASPLPCSRGPEGRAMRPRRQHAITTLAVRAFLDAELAADPERRAAARRYLGRGIAVDFEEVELGAPPPDQPSSSVPSADASTRVPS
jgi:predicted dienelactone hydrolase